jgi:hypothetical protein
LFRNQTVSLGIEKNGGRFFRRPKLTLSCSAEGRKEGRKEGIFSIMHPKCPAHLTFLGLIIMKLLITQFSPTSSHFITT